MKNKENKLNEIKVNKDITAAAFFEVISLLFYISLLFLNNFRNTPKLKPTLLIFSIIFLIIFVLVIITEIKTKKISWTLGKKGLIGWLAMELGISLTYFILYVINY